MMLHRSPHPRLRCATSSAAAQVYVIRQSVTSWSLLYLIREKAVPAADAAVRVSGLELGGLLGSLSAGALSDRLIRRHASDSNIGTVGLRVKVRWPRGEALPELRLARIDTVLCVCVCAFLRRA